MKLADIAIACVIVLLFATFTFVYNKKTESAAVDISFIMHEKLDSVQPVPTGYNIYYPKNLIKVTVTQKHKFVSPSDTIITLVDTTGQPIGSQSRLSKLDKELKLRIIEIILLKK